MPGETAPVGASKFLEIVLDGVAVCSDATDASILDESGKLGPVK